MNKELMGALDELERDKNISKETLLDAIEQPGCAQENVVMEPTLVERRSVRKVYRRLRR